MSNKNIDLRTQFEAQASDPSFKFARSRKGTYVNPALARDWKWFQAGVANKSTEAAAMAATVPADSIVMDWKAETNDPVAEMDAIMKVYEESMGITPGPVMARVVGKTKQMLLMWWGWHRDTIRAALVAAKQAPVAGQPAEPSPADPAADAWATVAPVVETNLGLYREVMAERGSGRPANDGGTPGPWFVRTLEKNGKLRGCFVAAPDCQGMAYDAEILGDDEYRGTDEDEDAGIKRRLADCRLIVAAVNAHRLASKGNSNG